MPKLYVLSGPDLGRSFEAGAGALIGRGAECAVRLRDPSVSRAHARLEIVPEEGWQLVDLGSRNGITAGGVRVARAGLADGEEVLLGEVLLRFRADVAVGTAPGAAAHAATVAASAPGATFERAPPADKELVLEDEILLEGEWTAPPARPEEPAPTSAPARVSTQAPRGAPASAVPVRAPVSTASAPDTGPLAPSLDARAARPAADAGFSARGAASAGRGILQYKREPDRAGFLHADLAQQPLWIRAGVWLLVLVVFAGLFWAAFRATAYFKERTSERPAADAAVEETR